MANQAKNSNTLAALLFNVESFFKRCQCLPTFFFVGIPRLLNFLIIEKGGAAKSLCFHGLVAALRFPFILSADGLPKAIENADGNATLRCKSTRYGCKETAS